MPPLDLDDRGHAAQLALGIAFAGVAGREVIEVDELRVVSKLDDAAQQRDVVVPALAEDRQRDPRVAAQVTGPWAAGDHAQQEVAVLPAVPGGGRGRSAVRPHGADDRRAGR
jgi:hypothetical protein